MVVIQVAAGPGSDEDRDGALSSAVMAISKSKIGLKIMFPHVKNGGCMNTRDVGEPRADGTSPCWFWARLPAAGSAGLTSSYC